MRHRVTQFVVFIALIFALLSCSAYSSAVRRGDQFNERYMLHKAESTYKKAIRHNPDIPIAWTRLARLYLMTGRHGEAHLLLLRANALKKKSADTFALLASLAHKKSDPLRALYYLETGLTLFPHNTQLLKQRSEVNLTLFVKRIEKILSKYPDATPLRKMLGFRYLHDGYIHLALKQFDMLAKPQKADTPLYRMLARRFMKAGQSHKAKEYLEKILSIDRTDLFALSTLGKMALEDGYQWIAYRYYFDAAKYHPNNATAFTTLGQLTLRMGKKDKALEYLLRAHTLGNRSHAVQTAIGYLYASSPDADERKKAQPFLDAAGTGKRKKQPLPLAHARAAILSKINRLKQFERFFSGNTRKEADTQYHIALLYNKTRQYRSAYGYALKAFHHFPEDQNYNLLLADLEQSLGRYGNLLATLTRLKALIPGSRELFLRLCRVYEKGPLKDISRYRRTLKKALNRYPDETAFLFQLAKLHDQENAQGAALLVYKKIASLQPSSSLTKKIKKLEYLLTIKGLTHRLSHTNSVGPLLRLINTIKSKTHTGHPLHRQALLKAVALRPESPGLHTLTGEAMGAAFFKELRYTLLSQAIAHLQKAIKLFPGHTPARTILAKLLNYDHAGFLNTTRHLEKIQKINAILPPSKIKNRLAESKKYPELTAGRFFTLGKILYRKNGSTNAIPYLKRALTLDSRERIDRLLALGSVLRDFGRYGLAIKVYQSLLKQKKLPEYRQYTIIHATLGNLYAAIAATWPHDTATLLSAYPDAFTNPSVTAKKISTHITSMKSAAAKSYRAYIQRNNLYIQRNMGKKKIQAMNTVQTDIQEAYLRMAAILQAEDRSKESISLLEQASQAVGSGKRNRILLALAALHAAKQNNKETTRIYDLLAKENKNSWKNIYAHARWNLSSGRIQKSLELFKKAATLNKGDLNLLIIISFLHWKLGQTERAINDLEQVLKRDANNINANYYLCKILSGKGEHLKAEKFGNRIHEIFKKHLPATLPDPNKKEMLLDTLHTLAAGALQRGDTIRSMQYAYLGLNFDQEDRYHFLSLTGDIFFLQKKFYRAEKYYLKAVTHNTGIPFLRFKLAKIFLKTGKRFRARRILENILTKNLDFHHRADLMLLLARVRQMDRDTKGSEKLLLRAIKEFPHLEEGYLALSFLYKKQNRFVEQGEILEKGLATIRKTAAIRDALAWYILDRSRPLNRALQLAAQNLETHPGSAEYRATFGYLLFRIRQYKKSRNTLSQPMIARYRKRDFFKKRLSLENAQEYFRIGNYPKAYSLICYPRPYTSDSPLNRDILFSRLFFAGDTGNHAAN